MSEHLCCDDCGIEGDLLIVAADVGEGAFLAVLCETCWHRRKYRGQLLRRLEWKRRGSRG
jgi:hypothetical protein